MTTLEAIRNVMTSQGLDAFIVGSEDRHQSEYVCDADMRRAFISGFNGSAGTALILKDKALLWTDGRYFLQAEKQLSSEWTLMKAGEKDVPDLQKWILSNLKEGQVVGIDAWLVSTSSAKALQKRFSEKGILLHAVEANPVDQIWTDRPPAPIAPLVILPITTSGVSHMEKITNLRKKIHAVQAVGTVITMLDEVAWLLNLRGGDIAYNPVFFSYLIVTMNHVQLFIDTKKVTGDVREHLGEGIEVLDYDAIEASLSALAATGSVLVDPSQISWRLYNLLGSAVKEEPSSVTLAKSLKNEAELAGMRACHIRDGVALTAFLRWLEEMVTTFPHRVTECSAAEKLEDFRRKMTGHVGPSFATIAGFAANGAIIHYKPEPESCATLGTESIFLLDSGAQYLDGTTDVTRTVHFGHPTEHMKTCYTAVLKVGMLVE